MCIIINLSSNWSIKQRKLNCFFIIIEIAQFISTIRAKLVIDKNIKINKYRKNQINI